MGVSHHLLSCVPRVCEILIHTFLIPWLPVSHDKLHTSNTSHLSIMYIQYDIWMPAMGHNCSDIIVAVILCKNNILWGPPPANVADT
jgi:hypothetical protein